MTTHPFQRSRVSPRILIISTFALIAFLFAARPAAAQVQWQRTVEVITPIDEGSPMQALLDTLAAGQGGVAQMRVSKKPKGQKRPLRSVDESLLDQGLSLASANRVFMRYRFTAGSGGFNEDLLSLQFIYRPVGGQSEDISVVYLDASDSDVREFLRASGLQSEGNELATESFNDHLSFFRLAPDAEVTSMSGRVIRSPQAGREAKAELMATLRRLAR